MTNQVSSEEIARVDYIHGELDRGARRDSIPDSGIPDSGVFLIREPDYLGPVATHAYSADEMRAWPRMKAAMVALLTSRKDFDYVRVSHDRAVPMVGSGINYMGTSKLECPDIFARGLYMTREMLEPKRDKCEHCDGAHQGADCPVTYPGSLNLSTATGPALDAYAADYGIERTQEPSRHYSAEFAKMFADCERVISRSILGQSMTIEKPGEAMKKLLPSGYTGNDLSADRTFRERSDYGDTLNDPSRPMVPTNRERLVAALAAEMRRPVVARFPPEGRSERALPRSNGR